MIIAAISTLVVTTPAAATTATVLACTNNGPYSFRTAVATTYSTIYVHRGSGCGGDAISYGRTTLVGSDVVIYAIDIACDNVGLTTTVSGGWSVPSTGCNTTNSHRTSRSSSGGTFWVTVGGRYMSPLHSIPI
ncbi:hypothetical protein [Nonomuraea sp. NPDC049480]|uniref:hypothetical protein n=1 Tax=Nonomuraea sp. NPDC049480 TaxID=3364353 RepID=UPI0037AF2515